MADMVNYQKLQEEIEKQKKALEAERKINE